MLEIFSHGEIAIPPQHKLEIVMQVEDKYRTTVVSRGMPPTVLIDQTHTPILLHHQTGNETFKKG